MTKTTKLLQPMKMFLCASTIVNLMVSTFAFTTQVRNVNNIKSSAQLCQGVCKYFGPAVCFNLYNIGKITVMTAGIINLNTIYYRMISIKYREKSLMRMKLSFFSLLYVFPIAIFVMSYIPEIDFDAVYSETVQLHPEYNYEPYLKFGGFADSHNIYNSLNVFIFTFFTFVGPIVGYIWRRTSFKVLHTSLNSLSSHSISQIRSFLNALTFQIVVPLICYVPITALYIVAKYSGTQFLAGQFLLPIMGSFPAVTDPILILYFIRQYRIELKNMISSIRAGVGTSEQPKI